MFGVHSAFASPWSAAIAPSGASGAATNLAFAQSLKLMNWFPLMTLPMFVFMG